MARSAKSNPFVVARPPFASLDVVSDGTVPLPASRICFDAATLHPGSSAGAEERVMTLIDDPPDMTAIDPGSVGAPNARPLPPPSYWTGSTLDVGALRHPTESSRFALALLGCTAVVSLVVFGLVASGAVKEMLVALLVVVGLFVLIWLSVQLWRIRLLADGVKVDVATLPEVQQVVDFVRHRLAYDRRLEIFVVDKVSRVMAADAPPITLTSYFGVRVIVAEGAALGDLSNERERQQLVFVLATYIGALKARHTRWSPYLMALEMLGLGKLVSPLVSPWYRATVYTGDRIAYACCGDLGVSLEAVYRTLVGKEVAPHLRDVGLVAQALAVRRKVVLRLAQLLRRSPHATSRYLDLLSFVAEREPDAYRDFRELLGPSPGAVDQVIATLQNRRRLAAAAPVSVVLALLMLLVSAAAGVAAQADEYPPEAAGDFTDGGTQPTEVPPTATVEEVPDTVVTDPVGPPAVPATLHEMFPGVDFSQCVELTDASGRAVALQGARCTFRPGIIAEFQSYTSSELERDVAVWIQSATSSDTWRRGDSTIGRILYVPLASGAKGIYWTYDRYGFAVLAYAAPGEDVSFSDVESWWVSFRLDAA
jgi:hypothetical protein